MKPPAISPSPVAERALTAVLLLILLTMLPHSTAAQIISPGRLSEPHSQLSGITNCTRCHELGTPGISDTRCLSCHIPVAQRIAQDRGFHASDSTSVDCASCHSEHFGETFPLIRFDTLSFEHATVGYRLEGAHTETECRSCHTPQLVTERSVLEFHAPNASLDRTYLGLSADCVSCHRADDPHEGQFADQSCESCHSMEIWEEAPGFDHADLRPPTNCVSCHQPDDPHAGQFSDRSCDACHSTERWEESPSFDHASTRYPLTGLHASLTCTACHRTVPRSGAAEAFVRYAPLSFAECTACHQDPHDDAMEGSCSTCHSTGGWNRVDPEVVEGRFSHSSTAFALEGAHARAACATCHDPGGNRPDALHLSFLTNSLESAFPTPDAATCVSCHVDAHQGALADAPGGIVCTSCHGQEQWLPSAFNLERHNTDTRFELLGSHLTVACEACHRNPEGALVLEPAFESCTACHQEDDPHAGQFTEQSCDGCHTVESFLNPAFDHAATDFALEGGHEGVECAACHRTEENPGGSPFVRYAPLTTACADCHGSDLR